MLNKMDYVRQSIETNLFFLRIIKEHLIFASAALTLENSNLIPALMDLKNEYEELLINTIRLASGVVNPQTLMMGDIVTPYTLRAEIETQNYTGLPINTDITMLEADLMRNTNNSNNPNNPMIEQSVYMLNQRIINLLRDTIQAKKVLLNNVLSCKMFTTMYPLMLEHVTREAEHYLDHLQKLQSYQSMNDGPKAIAHHEEFWNNIMAEHAKFIHGLIDPSETQIMGKAHEFINEFTRLTQQAKEAYDQPLKLPQVTKDSNSAASNIRDFKVQGTMGILECKIRSIILPLLSDHVLREANHYLKDLKEFRV